MEGDKRFLVISAPTGTGKSLLSLIAERATGKRTHTLVSTIRLQDQMRTSYRNAPILKGRTNYDCLITNVTVSEAPCQVGFSCDERGVCPYYLDRESAFEANYAVFNYQLFMNQLVFSQTFRPPDILFLDEAHLATMELEKFITANISESDIRKERWQRPTDRSVHGMATWAERYIGPVAEKVDKNRKAIFAIIGGSSGNTVEGSGYDYKKAVARYNRYKGLERNLQLFIKAGYDTENGKTWVDEKVGPVYSVRPLYVDEYGEALFGGVEKVVLMSATIGEQDIENLGIGDDDYEIIEVDSSFNEARRPIYYEPVANVTRKTEPEVMPIIVAAIDRHVGRHMGAGHKGIIHTVSYERAKTIKGMSKHRDRMLVHTAKDKDEIIAKFKDAREPVVLLSPSVLEGEDFPYNECRFIIIPKVPYLSLADKVVRARQLVDPEQYSWKAVQNIIQGSGRGMRSESDTCSIYILDRQFENLLEAHEEEIPKWFRDAIVDWKAVNG